MRYFKSITRSGFTLVETVVALAVFALIMVSLTGALISAQRSWSTQTQETKRLQETRWAMELMSNEIRMAQVDTVTVPNGNQVHFVVDTAGDGSSDVTIWYWRDGISLYRGQVAGDSGSFASANSSRQPLLSLVANNSSGNELFNELDNGLVALELTTRPDPASAAGAGNQDLTLRTYSRARQ
jgi:prepilin-type N-terminal cleavage/methylation domain-containing protein